MWSSYLVSWLWQPRSGETDARIVHHEDKHLGARCYLLRQDGALRVTSLFHR
jgi:hypothetical protein